MKIAKWTFISILLLVIPISAFALFKPIRVITPEIFGIHCQNENLCVEDDAQFTKALDLYNKSKNNLESKLGINLKNPKIIFCSTEKCKLTFGLSKAAGYAFGTFGMIIAPRGWTEYYVTHELIHHWQSQEIGNIKSLFIEEWIKEGMAYSLSKDPRKTLSEPFQTYRLKFDNWCKNNCSNNLELAFKSEATWW